MPGFGGEPKEEHGMSMDIVALSKLDRNLTWEQKVLRELAKHTALLEELVAPTRATDAAKVRPQPKGKR